jgi:hypothetical protein
MTTNLYDGQYFIQQFQQIIDVCSYVHYQFTTRLVYSLSLSLAFSLYIKSARASPPILIGLHHPLDGVTNLAFQTTNNFL